MNGRSEVARLHQRLDKTFERADHFSESVDLETRADFARYLCILVSGYLEKAIRELVQEHSRQHGGPTLQRFVEKNTRRFTNANSTKLRELLGSFNSEWESALNSVLVDELKDAVDSIVALRNQIAHGDSATVTLSQVKDYYSRIQRVIEEIAKLCAPTSSTN